MYEKSTGSNTCKSVQRQSLTDSVADGPFFSISGELFPSGLPQLAKAQDVYFNASYFRKFGYVNKRRLQYLQGRVAYLEKMLIVFELEHSTHHRSLTNEQKRAPWEAHKQEKLDKLLEEIDTEANRYCMLPLPLRW